MSESPGLLIPSLDIQNHIVFEQRKCLVCFRVAYCRNYGVYTCDACKMFFRRIATEKLVYECKNNNSCFLAYTEYSEDCPKCKACRFQRCVDNGMNYEKRETKRMMTLKMKKDDELQDIIGGLLHRDRHRTEVMTLCYTDRNPSLLEMTERVELKIYVKTSDVQLQAQDWSFFALYTTVEFFLQLDFMRNLQTVDRLTLLVQSASKCSLFSGAMRTYKNKQDRMVTVDGQDIYPDVMKDLLGAKKGSDVFLNRIRKYVVSKLIELQLTTEEYVLISVILFCNPGPFSEPDNAYARNIIESQQQKYTAILFQYCNHTYQQNGPTRFSDLLSLCPIIQQNFEDLQYLTLVFRISLKDKAIQFRRIVEELI